MIHIYYRLSLNTNPFKKRPHDWSKEVVIQKCHDSFSEAFGKVDCAVTYIIDGDKNSDEGKKIRGILGTSMLSDSSSIYINRDDYVNQVSGNMQTFKKQLDLAQEQDGPVFLVEDDYIFKDWAGKIMAKVLKSKNIFITPYDHPNYYNDEYRIEEKIKNNIFRSVCATTLTFAASSGSMIKETRHIWNKHGISDYEAWKEILRDSKYSLLAPQPSAATHAEKDWLSFDV